MFYRCFFNEVFNIKADILCDGLRPADNWSHRRNTAVVLVLLVDFEIKIKYCWVFLLSSNFKIFFLRIFLILKSIIEEVFSNFFASSRATLLIAQ